MCRILAVFGLLSYLLREVMILNVDGWKDRSNKRCKLCVIFDTYYPSFTESTYLLGPERKKMNADLLGHRTASNWHTASTPNHLGLGQENYDMEVRLISVFTSRLSLYRLFGFTYLYRCTSFSSDSCYQL